MKLSLLSFVLRRVRGSLGTLFWVHLLAASVMAMTLFIFGGFMLLETNLQRLLKGWSDHIEITAYLNSDSSAGDTTSLIERLRAMPEVERVRHTSRDQAWQDFQTALGAQSGLLQGLPREALPESLEISLAPSYRDSPAVERLTERLKKEGGVASVEYPQEWVERLGFTVLVVEWSKWIVAGALILATFFVVGNTLKLAAVARRDEVEILQSVGASEEVIQAPFVIEGMVQGLLGGTLALAGLAVVFVLLQREVATMSGLWAPLAELTFLSLPSMGLLLGAGSLVGAVGSLVSLRRFLRTWHASNTRA